MRARLANAALCVGTTFIVFVALDSQAGAIHRLGIKVLPQLSLLRVVLALASLSLVAAIASLAAAGRSLRLTGRLSKRATVAMLGAIVGTSAGIWRGLGAEASLPRVLGDELLYVSLGKSLARGDTLLLRGVETRGYGIGYPLFLAPFYALTNNGVAGYHAVQAAQALVMASAAIPVYLLARRAMSRELSLVCAALAAATPSMLFSTLVMTEALYYPVFAWFCVVAVRALDHPAPARQLAALGMLAVLIGVRLQGVIVVAALVTAVLARPRRGERRAYLRRWWPTALVLGVVTAAALVVSVATGTRTLGAYSVLIDVPDVWPAVVWSLRSAGALAVATGLVATAILVPAVVRLLRGSPQERSLGALIGAATFWLVLSVGHFSSTRFGLDHVHERNLITGVPLVIVAAMAWSSGGMPRPLVVTGLGAFATIASVASLRRGDLLTRFDADALSILPWRELHSGIVPAERSLLLATLIAAAVAVSTRRQWVIPLTIALAMLVATPVAQDFDRDATRVLSWVDDQLGKDANVLVVTLGAPDRDCEPRALQQLAFWTEFFNVSTNDAAHVFAENESANLDSRSLTIGPDGHLLDDDGEPITPEALVIDARVALVGATRSATLAISQMGGQFSDDPARLSLWELRGSSARIENVAAIRQLVRCHEEPGA